uniref:RIN4 pathogenic type III effector avirulence factor Avr cleavage site domain-containing protein n=1 Tax=Leersia perrieri TaxID=77586 RepID=A0A0D9WSE1_9ORYZ
MDSVMDSWQVGWPACLSASRVSRSCFLSLSSLLGKERELATELAVAVAVVASFRSIPLQAYIWPVPKFGTWEGDNVGYTVYFEKVRENKGATAPPLYRPFNPNDPADDNFAGRMINPSAAAAAAAPPSSSSSSSTRPATSSGHREPQRRQQPPPNVHHHHQNQNNHRRTGSNSSVSSDPGGANLSKFAPPPQYHPRPSPQHDHGHYNGGGGGARRSPAPAPQMAPAPRARSTTASPLNSNTPGRQRATPAVPKFGVWDEQNGAAAAQGFTVQFDNVKRNREVAKGAGPAGVVPRSPPPEMSMDPPKNSRDHSLVSKMFGCFLPTNRH